MRQLLSGVRAHDDEEQLYNKPKGDTQSDPGDHAERVVLSLRHPLFFGVCNAEARIGLETLVAHIIPYCGFPLRLVSD
jgi:hypothetical protein